MVMFSGGKDSTAMLLRMLEEGMRVDDIVYCDTGLEFPEMHDHIREVERYTGREITKLKEENGFMFWACEYKSPIKSPKYGLNIGESLHGKGWPSAKKRWCTRILKQYVVKAYEKELRKKYNIVKYVGLAADEEYRLNRRENITGGARHPLAEWGMTEADALQYCLVRGFDWGGLYETFGRVSCWCCPLQGMNSLRALKYNRPELWEELRRIDHKIRKSLEENNPPEIKGGTPYNFKATFSFDDIDRRLKLEEEFAAQGKPTHNKAFFNECRERGIKLY